MAHLAADVNARRISSVASPPAKTRFGDGNRGSLCHGSKRSGKEAWTLRLLGEIHAACEPPDISRAETFYRAARDLAQTLGMRPLVAHCHVGLANLYRRVGDREQAESSMATAAQIYQEIDAKVWLRVSSGNRVGA
jgi:hypothetical protein